MAFLVFAFIMIGLGLLFLAGAALVAGSVHSLVDDLSPKKGSDE